MHYMERCYLEHMMLDSLCSGIVFCSGTGSLVAITEDLLCFDRDAYNAKLEEDVEITNGGIEEAFI